MTLTFNEIELTHESAIPAAAGLLVPVATSSLCVVARHKSMRTKLGLSAENELVILPFHVIKHGGSHRIVDHDAYWETTTRGQFSYKMSSRSDDLWKIIDPIFDES